MIDKEDLRVGLITTTGARITAIGEQSVLYVSHDDCEFSCEINYFCEQYTEKKKNEIIEIELVIALDGFLHFIDNEDNIAPKFENLLCEPFSRTGIKLQYNKTTNKFVKIDKYKKCGLIEVQEEE